MKRVFWGLTALPILLVPSLQRLYNPDFLIMDEWDFVPTVAKFLDGTFTFSDLFLQHNEHRIPLAKGLVLGIIRWTAWDVRYEAAFSTLLTLALFGFWLSLSRRMARELGRPLPTLFYPLLALLVFSPSQWENWYLGWQLCIFLSVLATYGGLLTLARGEGWTMWALAVAAGVTALYSFGTGLLFWPLGLGIILYRFRGKRAKPIGWVLASMLVLAPYLWRYKGGVDLRHVVLYRKWEFVRYVFEYLGAPFASYSQNMAFAAGVLVIVSFIALAWHTRDRDAAERARGHWVLMVAIGLFAIGCAVLSGLARVRFGPGQSLASRYITFTTGLWLVTALMAWRAGLCDTRWLPRVVAGALALGFLVNAVAGAGTWREQYLIHVPAREALLRGEVSGYATLHPDTARIAQYREILVRHRLSLWR